MAKIRNILQTSKNAIVFLPPPAWRRTQQKRGGTRRQRKDIYNKVWTNRENTQAGTKTSHITYIDNTITLYIN